MHNGTLLLYNTFLPVQLFWTSYLLSNVPVKVGDPKQLPATVMSGLASKFLYECSMFERLQRAGYPVIMLTKQVVYYYIILFLQHSLEALSGWAIQTVYAICF